MRILPGAGIYTSRAARTRRSCHEISSSHQIVHDCKIDLSSSRRSIQEDRDHQWRARSGVSGTTLDVPKLIISKFLMAGDAINAMYSSECRNPTRRGGIRYTVMSDEYISIKLFYWGSSVRSRQSRATEGCVWYSIDFSRVLWSLCLVLEAFGGTRWAQYCKDLQKQLH